MTNTKRLMAFFVVVVVLFFISVGYFTRYVYFKVGRGEGLNAVLRTNRYTNETDMLTNRGWEVVQTSKQWADLHWNKTHPIDSLPPPVPIYAPKDSK
jgi:hypothetical protein